MSILRTIGAAAIYIAIVLLHLTGIDALTFSLLVAVLLGIGLYVHGHDDIAGKRVKHAHSDQSCEAIPSLTESMEQLHSLQASINQLQTDFNNEKSGQQT